MVSTSVNVSRHEATRPRRQLLPDGAGLFLVVLVAALMRLAFLFRAPPLYVGGDSQTYLQPAVDLLAGAGFDPEIKRPPGYPLFLAAVMATLGRDLQAVNFVQHVLGVATAAATWGIGRLTYGRGTALLAGLLVAVNGPLLIVEHYILAEALATCLVTLAVLVTLYAARGSSVSRLLLSGLLFGLAAACHQRTQILVSLVPLTLLAAGNNWRRVLRGSAVAALGFLVVLVPWVASDYARRQVPSASALGETLTWRLTRNGEESYFKGKLAPVSDPGLQQARKFAYEQAADRVLPGDIKAGLAQRFGMADAEADRLMRSLALEAIAQRPDRYLASSGGLLLQNLLGSEQWLGGQGKEGGRTHYTNVQDKYEDWWSERTRPLIQNATAAQEREFRRAQALADIFQPYRFGLLLLALFVVGIAAAIASPRQRIGLVLAVGTLALLALSAFLAGALPRFRYPVEPLLAVTEMGGLVALLTLAARLARLARRGRFRAVRPQQREAMAR